jgi:hypothetical protein
MRDKEQSSHREIRKRQGIYYTPADVANFMVSSALTRDNRTVFDPACGSGVFLRASALTAGDEDLAVYGCDISPWAVEAAAYVVLSARLRRESDLPPLLQWHLCRMNLATADSLALDPSTSLARAQQNERDIEVRLAQKELLSGSLPPPSASGDALTGLGALFPPLLPGADVLVTNPPYAPLGRRADVESLTSRFNSLVSDRIGRKTNMYPLFVEQAWRLTRAKGRACLVVPLSLAFSSDPSLRALRKAMQSVSGGWSLCFFDRAPDALFGDDVKTRNAIIGYDGSSSGIRTSQLLKWTSRTRPALFQAIRDTVLHTDITDRIPKLGSTEEARLYEGLRSTNWKLGESILSLGSTNRDGGTSLVGDSVYVGRTAYNWLSCMRNLGAYERENGLDQPALTRIVVSRREEADALYATLASRLVYWLWRVEGDGFHVPSSFLTQLPVSLARMNERSLTRLAVLGERLWSKASRAPILSVNKGRRTVSFPTYHLRSELDDIDACLFDSLGIQPSISLGDWYENLLIVDPQEQRRLARLRAMRKVGNASG